ncbi:hypothetical protein LTR86_005766 [Recurvomyces mirabilis]|nr:hypothetical protein LTR86_005766 [Recurvomyces mirabilis]
MAARILQDRMIYWLGYLQGWASSTLPRSPSAAYGLLVSKATSLISLPLPLLSVLAIPFVGGSSTAVNLVIFYLTWTALITSYGPLSVEIGGTMLVRLVCLLVPALACLAFDCALPKLSQGIKAHGKRQLPLSLGRDKVLEIAGVAVFNVLLSVAVQGALELFATRVMHTRSLLRVSAAVPLPWNLVKDVLKGLLLRGILRYTIHRYLLHTIKSQLRGWHLRWQHSIGTPFSVVAAYDHPVNYLLSQWLPVFLPAYLFRFHVLAWHILLAVASLEELFVYSGYAVLPSGIVLPGMARRTEAHFDSVSQRKVGNFGHLGLLDFVCGTSCDHESDVVDDVEAEAKKHRLPQRASGAIRGAIDGLQGNVHDGSATAGAHQSGANAADDEDWAADQDADESTTSQTRQRKSGRKNAGKR